MNKTDKIKEAFYANKPRSIYIPAEDGMKLAKMASMLPVMAMRGDLKSPKNQINHWLNLKVMYEASGMAGCEEYYDKIMAKYGEKVAPKWYVRIWRWIVKKVKR